MNTTDIEELSRRYGKHNVEAAMIFILEQKHPTRVKINPVSIMPHHLAVRIPATRERVEAILGACHDEFLS